MELLFKHIMQIIYLQKSFTVLFVWTWMQHQLQEADCIVLSDSDCRLPVTNWILQQAQTTHDKLFANSETPSSYWINE